MESKRELRTQWGSSAVHQMRHLKITDSRQFSISFSLTLFFLSSQRNFVYTEKANNELELGFDILKKKTCHHTHSGPFVTMGTIPFELFLLFNLGCSGCSLQYRTYFHINTMVNIWLTLPKQQYNLPKVCFVVLINSQHPQNPQQWFAEAADLKCSFVLNNLNIQTTTLKMKGEQGESLS